jgi:hypothetical protein
MSKPTVKKEKDFSLEKVGDTPAPTEEEISREDILTYLDSLAAQANEYDINVRNPIDIRLTVIRGMLDIVAVPFASLASGVNKPYVEEDTRKEANALMLKLIKQINTMFDEEE